MKKTIYSIIVLLVAIAIVVAVVSWKNQDPATPHQPGTSAVSGSVTPKMVDVSHDSYLYSIEGSYPQFPQATNAFNASIANLINGSIEDFRKTAQEDYDARLEIGGEEFRKQFERGDTTYTYSVKADIVQSNEKFISVAVRQEGYAGGAHGWHVVSTFNYDVQAKKILSLTDFMTLQQAADASRADLKKQFGALGDTSTFDGFALGGTDPAKPENYANFTFTEKDLTIYFNEYQVAPYVYGEMKVVIPRS